MVISLEIAQIFLTIIFQNAFNLTLHNDSMRLFPISTLEVYSILKLGKNDHQNLEHNYIQRTIQGLRYT